MKKIILQTLCMLYATIGFAQQDFDINWTKKINYESHSTGYFESFVGGNDKYVYALFKPAVAKEAKTIRFLYAYDKATMKELGKLKLSFTEDFNNVYVGKNVIYLVTMTDVRGKEDIYAQTFTPSLEILAAKKQVATTITSDKRNSKNFSNTKILINKNASDNLYILSEGVKSKDESKEIIFKIIDKNLTDVNDGTVTLPIINISDVDYFSSPNIRIGDDGNIICKDAIKATREERREDKLASYALLNVINPVTKVNNSIPIKAQDKSIIDFDYYSMNNKLHIIGIYKDVFGKKSEREEGIFSSVLNTATNEFENVVYNPVKDRKIYFGILTLERIKHDNFGNAFIQAGEDENIVTETRTRDRQTGFTTTSRTYSNRKGDILNAYVNADGTIKWTNVVNRQITYGTLHVRDINAIMGKDNSYMTYATVIKAKEKSSIFSRKKSNKELSTTMNYAKMDNTDGKVSKKEINLNGNNKDPKTARGVSATATSLIDDQLYLDGFDLKTRPGVTTLGCLTTPIFCFGIYYLFEKERNGKLYYGGGYLGKLSLKN